MYKLLMHSRKRIPAPKGQLHEMERQAAFAADVGRMDDEVPSASALARILVHLKVVGTRSAP